MKYYVIIYDSENNITIITARTVPEIHQHMKDLHQGKQYEIIKGEITYRSWQ